MNQKTYALTRLNQQYEGEFCETVRIDESQEAADARELEKELLSMTAIKARWPLAGEKIEKWATLARLAKGATFLWQPLEHADRAMQETFGFRGVAEREEGRKFWRASIVDGAARFSSGKRFAKFKAAKLAAIEYAFDRAENILKKQASAQSDEGVRVCATCF